MVSLASGSSGLGLIPGQTTLFSWERRFYCLSLSLSYYYYLLGKLAVP